MGVREAIIAAARGQIRPINPNNVSGGSQQSAQITIDQVTAKGLLIPPPGPLTFDTLFTEPSSGRHLALPKWKIATGMANGHRQVTMDPVAGQPSGWKLTVRLEPDTSPAGSDERIGAPQIAPVPSIAIQYMASDAPPFSVVEDNGGLVATLMIESIDRVTAIKQAMTDPHGGCKLVVTYQLNVATPIGPSPTGRPALVLKLRPPPPAATPPPHAATPPPHAVTPPPHAVTPPPHAATPPPHTATTGTPGDSKPLYTSSAVAPALELAFIFDETIEPVFQNLAISGNPAAPLVYSLDFEGAMYPYVKVNTAPDTFFYLPDSFKLCRSPDSPYYPQMSLAVSGDHLETATVMLTYLAVPVINARRLDDAKQKLAAYGVTKDGKPLGAPNPQLLLSWPGVKPGDGMYPPRPGVVVDLAAGFQDTLTLTAQQFLDLVDALFTGAGSPFFQGYVTVHVDKDNVPNIKFSGRADDLVASNLFDHTKSLDAASGGVRVVLTNGTEATLHVDELAAQLVQGDGSSVDGRVISIAPAPPCDVAPLTADGQPAGTIEVIMAPTTGVAAADWDVAFDLSKVQDKVERESFLAAISDSSMAGHVARVVHVRSPSAPFQTRPERYLTALVVTFAGGHSIELDKNSPTVGDNLTADAQLPVSMIDYLVRRVDLQPYQYKRQLIYSDGAKVADAEWTQDTSDILFVSLDPAPVT